MAVRLSPLAGAGWQFFTTTGTPLSGGKLYTYTAGTTTPLATYTTSTGATPCANPIILDSSGRTTTEVWLTTGSSYKFVLKTSADVTIDTYDNLIGVNDNSVAGVPWSSITSTPTTLAGYGIADSITAAAAAATYAPIASPTFTGDPKVPDSSGTTYSAGYKRVPVNSQTVNYQLVLADESKNVQMNGTSLTLTIPANASVAFPIGTTIAITNLNATSLSVAITTDTLTKAASTTTGTRTISQNGKCVITKETSTTWIISGSGLA